MQLKGSLEQEMKQCFLKNVKTRPLSAFAELSLCFFRKLIIGQNDQKFITHFRVTEFAFSMKKKKIEIQEKKTNLSPDASSPKERQEQMPCPIGPPSAPVLQL